MPKHYKEMMDELINKIDEDAPTNAVGDGSNVALPPKHEPGVKKNKRDPLMFAKPIKRKIKESDDNNNLVLRGLRTLDTRLKQHYENTKTIIKFLT